MRRQRSKETNTLRGLPEDAPINISVDVRYNSTNLKKSYSCGGQNAARTGQREIIAFQVDNKLCKLGSSLRSRGLNARRTENRRLFAEDVKTRCQMVYTSVHMLHDSDETAIARRMSDVIQTTLDCYAGSCANCHRYVIVCRSSRRNWWNTSPHLKVCGITQVNMIYGDRSTLQGLIDMCLDHVAHHMTHRRLTTYPNESANRAFSASLPKKCTGTCVFCDRPPKLQCWRIDAAKARKCAVSHYEGWKSCSGS